MSDQLMSLVRELKFLNARKKAGEALTPDEDRRRRELKRTLKAALESQKGGSSEEESTNVSSMTSGLSMSGTGSAPKPAPTPAPRPVPPAQTPRPNPFAIDAGALLDQATSSLSGAPEPEEYATAEVDDPELVEEFAADVSPAPSPAPGTKKDYSNAFKVDASDLFQEALGSEAVAAAAPEKVAGPGSASAAGTKHVAEDFESWLGGDTGKAMRNPPKVIEDMASKADKALAETKKRERAVEPEAVVEQLADIFSGSGYTPPEMHLALEQYYGEYVDAEGLTYLEEPEVPLELSPIDPREVELYRAGLLSEAGGDEPSPVPNGLAFLDDFAALYERGVLPPADQELQLDDDDPNLLIPGKRKVTVHLLNGQVKRGVIRRFARDDSGFRLEPQGTGRAEDIPIQQCKAIFVHLAGKAPPAVQGPSLTVTFTDRRSVQGVSDDYHPEAPMFSLVPSPGPRSGQFERIIVNTRAVKAVR